MNKKRPQHGEPATLIRRLGAIFYDGMLLFSVLFFFSGVALMFNDGEAYTADNWRFSAYLGGITYLYFVWQWIRGGQTLGMRAWHIRVETPSGAMIGWAGATVRFFVAIVSWLVAMAGFLWVFVDRDHLTWHDRASDSRLVMFKRSR